MSDVWRCAVCEGVNVDAASCATCGAPRSTAARRPEPARAPSPAGDRDHEPRRAPPARPSRTTRFADAARTAAAAQSERLEQLRRIARERREAELAHRERARALGEYEAEPERPRLRVIPTPFGCLFSFGPRRRRRWR